MKVIVEENRNAIVKRPKQGYREEEIKRDQAKMRVTKASFTKCLVQREIRTERKK